MCCSFNRAVFQVIIRKIWLLALCAVLWVGCVPVTAPVLPVSGTTAVSSTRVVIPTLTLMPRLEPSQTLTATPTVSLRIEVSATPTANCFALQDSCILDGHFLMQRPIAASGNDSVDHTYRYGSTQEGRREPHHGVEFANAQGTPVLAVADGVVVFADNDQKVALALVPGFYGNVVVIEHHFEGFAPAVYSLYAHQFKINVQVGQKVSAGEQIGQVGATGIAIGSHLHFEVRLGANDYRSTRNPELWLAPLPGSGVLAGRIQDASGNSISGKLNIQWINNGVLNVFSVGSAESYVINGAQPVNPDDYFQEKFLVGELPAGEYRLTLIYNDKIYEQVVKIEPARLTFVKFFVK